MAFVKTRTHQTYYCMIERCEQPRNPSYIYYGARGITVCVRWRESFANFLEDMGERPTGMTIDRINADLGYFKENCRWADARTQSRMRKATKLTADDVKQIKVRLRAGGKLRPIALDHGVSHLTIRDIKQGKKWADIP